MGHATLFDVFQAAAGTAETVMDIVSKEKKYVQDIDLFNASMDMERRQNEIVQARKLIYDDSGINYQQNPEYPSDFAHYLDQQMGQWETEWGEKYPTSGYFADNMRRVKARGDLVLQRQLLDAEADYAIQRVNTTYANELAVINNHPGLSADERLRLGLELTERTRGAAGWNEATYQKYRQNVLAGSLEEKLKFTAGEGITAEEVRTYFDAILSAGLKSGEGEDGEGAGIYAALPGAREAVETAREGAVKAQQAFNYRALNALDSEYDTARKNYTNAVQSGDPEKVNAAYRLMMNAYQAGKPRRDAALGERRGDYNDDNRAQIVAMFADPPEQAKAKSEGGAAASARRTTLSHEIKSMARRVLDQYRGDLRDAEGKRRTLTINEAYFGLDLLVKSLDLDMPESEYRAMFDDEFTTIVRTETGSNEAARFVSMLLQDPLIENTPEARNVTGYQSKTNNQTDPRQKAAVNALNDEYFNQALNVIARIGLLPGNRTELNQTIASLRQVYTGSLTKILFDTSVAEGSASTVSDTGNTHSLAQWLQAVESTPAAHIPSRVEGGSAASSTMDDTMAARTQQADEYMRTALAEKGIRVIDTNRDGKYVTAADSNGTMYRLRSETRMMPHERGRGEAKRDVLIIEERSAHGPDPQWKEILVSPALTGGQQFGETLRTIFTSPPPGTIPNRDHLPTVQPPGWRWSRK